jgi:hypothetical protein
LNDNNKKYSAQYLSYVSAKVPLLGQFDIIVRGIYSKSVPFGISKQNTPIHIIVFILYEFYKILFANALESVKSFPTFVL